MVDLVFNFKTLGNVFTLFALFFIFCGWSYYALKKKTFSLFIFPLIVQAGFLVTYVRIAGLNMDEAEHLHCAWMVGQGMVPFRDFWQHHSPLLWVLLAPAMKAIKPSAAIFEISRLFSLGVFLLIVLVGWRIARKAWGDKAHLPSYLFMVLSASIMGEYFTLRPDLYLTLFLLIGVYVSLAIPQGRLFPVFIAGVCVGLAESFISKQYFLALLPLVALFLLRRNKSFFWGVFIYALGIALGSIPLLLYLFKNHIIKDFIHWVFTSNKERIKLTVMFPLAISALGVFGAWRLFGKYLRERNAEALVLAAAFCLSVASSFTGCVFSFPAGYYLQFLFIVGAACAAGGVLFEAVDKAGSIFKKAAVAGALCTLLVSPNFSRVMSHENSFFGKDKQSVAQLLAYSKNDTCVVLLPYHPIFCFDATRLYSSWQYVFCDNYKDVREDALTKDITQTLLTNPPAIILARLNKRDLMLNLYLKGLIREKDYRPLKALLDERYTIKEIGGVEYYIRNDRL